MRRKNQEDENEGGTQKIRRTKPRNEEGGRDNRRRLERGQKAAPPPEPVAIVAIPKKEVTAMGAGSGRNQQPVNRDRGESPFGVALYAARQINTARPADDQPAELRQLVNALSHLDGDGQRNLFFRLVGEVLEERTPIQPLFAVAREVKIPGNDGRTHNMVGSAYNVAALARAIKEGNLTIADLVAVGLAEVKLGKDRDGKDRNYMVPRIGHQAIVDGAAKLRRQGKVTAAMVLETHIRKGENKRLLRNTTGTSTATPTPEEPAQAEA